MWHARYLGIGHRRERPAANELTVAIVVHHGSHAFRQKGFAIAVAQPALLLLLLMRSCAPLPTTTTTAVAPARHRFAWFDHPNKVRAELTARIEQLNRGRSNTEAWVKALRHDLAEERAKKEAAEARLAVVSDRAEVCAKD